MMSSSTEISIMPIAHAGLQRNRVARVWLAAQSGERGARVGEGVHADAEPRHAVAAENAENAKRQNDRQRDADRVDRTQPSEVSQNHHRDECPQDHQELALRDHVGLAGLVDQLGDLAHGAMDRQVLELHVNGEAEEQSEAAEQDSNQQDVVSVHAQEADRGEIGNLQAGFAAGGFARLSEGCGSMQQENGQRGAQELAGPVKCYRRQPPQSGEPGVHMIPPMGPRRLQTSSAHINDSYSFSLCHEIARAHRFLEILDHPAGRARAEFRNAPAPLAAEMRPRHGPVGIPETRFHFKTEVLRFGRVGNTLHQFVCNLRHTPARTKGEFL